MPKHYAITGQVRYYKVPPTAVELRKPGGQNEISIDVSAVVMHKERPFDFSRWKDAPHVALANLRDEPEAVLRFTRTYGVLAPEYKAGEAANIPVKRVLEFRDELRRAWDGTDYFPFVTAIETTVRVWPNVDVAGANLRAGMEIDVKHLGHLIGVMFAQDFWEGRLKKCENPDCAAPYFRAVRKGQKFCTQKCAVLINVREFRKREVERKAKRGKHATAKKGR